MRFSKNFVVVAAFIVATVTTVYMARHMASQDMPPSPVVKPYGDNRAFILTEPMRYEVGSTGIMIEVPAGFVTDYASIPKPLWSFYSPHDQYSRAATLHDYLYWSQLCTRDQADNLFMIAMKESEVPSATRNAVYLAVFTLGGFAWKENDRQRHAKMPKVVPINEIKNFPPNWSWEMYRPHLMGKGVTDPVFTGNDYCALGDSTEVPNGSMPKSEAGTDSVQVVSVTRARDGWDYDAQRANPNGSGQ